MKQEEKMSKKEKLLSRLRQRPKDFTWDELATLLSKLGYEPRKKGKTAGSRRQFIHPTAAPIILHKPHPQNTLKRYAIDDIIEKLKNEGVI
jgi:predicted RNA binding protein YcfA (HicA-like mRNA interferase family)